MRPNSLWLGMSRDHMTEMRRVCGTYDSRVLTYLFVRDGLDNGRSA